MAEEIRVGKAERIARDPREFAQLLLHLGRGHFDFSRGVREVRFTEAGACRPPFLALLMQGDALEQLLDHDYGLRRTCSNNACAPCRPRRRDAAAENRETRRRGIR